VDLAEQGEFKPALALLERAAELYEEVHDSAGLARAYVNMGPLYGMLGELERGVSYSLKAEALAATLQPEPELTLHFASDLGACTRSWKSGTAQCTTLTWHVRRRRPWATGSLKPMPFLS